MNGSQFFNDARDVNGSLVSNYQSPFVNIAWTMRSGIDCEDGVQLLRLRRGRTFRRSLYCSTATSLTATVIPCTSAHNDGRADRTELRADRAAQLPREQRDPGNALRVLMAAVV